MRHVLLAAAMVFTAGQVFAQTDGKPAAAAQGPFTSLPPALSDSDTRLTTGVESMNRASLKSVQHLMVDFMLTSPLAGPATTRTSKPDISAWFNVRFNGAPNTAVSGVKQFVGGFEDKLVAGEVSSLFNALSFRAGIETKLMPPQTFQKHYQFQPTFIASAGLTTVPAADTPAIFDLSAEAKTRWPAAAALKADSTPVFKYIGFTEPDRRRFFPKWELGLRLKTHHFDECDPATEAGCDPNDRVNFPGTIDLTWGQDASVTGGERRGGVFSLDAFYPLPTDNLANAIYLFGRVRSYFRLKDLEAEQPPIILAATTATVAIPSPELFLHTLTADERTRDDWKFGIGVDLVRLFNGAAAARKKDDANAMIETGFSRVEQITDAKIAAEVKVTKVIVQPQEQGSFIHGTDFFLPLGDGRFEIRPPSGDSVMFRNFTKDAVEMVSSTKLRYKNVAAAQFETLLIRIQAGEAVSDSLLKLDKEEEGKIADGDRYRISKMSCKPCDLTSPKDTDNLLIVIPLQDATPKTLTGAQSTAWKAYQPLIVQRKTEFKLAVPAADFILVRLR